MNFDKWWDDVGFPLVNKYNMRVRDCFAMVEETWNAAYAAGRFDEFEQIKTENSKKKEVSDVNPV